MTTVGVIICEVALNVVVKVTVKKSVDFTVKYLASGCRYFYGRFTCRTFLEIKIW